MRNEKWEFAELEKRCIFAAVYHWSLNTQSVMKKRLSHTIVHLLAEVAAIDNMP